MKIDILFLNNEMDSYDKYFKNQFFKEYCETHSFEGKKNQILSVPPSYSKSNNLTFLVGLGENKEDINFYDIGTLIGSKIKSDVEIQFLNIEGDTNLTIEDFAFIYYGNVFTDSYNPYGLSKDQSKFMELYRAKKYKKAIAYGEKVLKENPVNLKITFKMMVCHHVLEELDQAKLYAKRYFPVLDCIYKGGDGLSEETAYVVIMVADEYEIMANMKVSMTSQSLVRNTDVLTLKKQEGITIEKLYFNVSMPLKNMAEKFKK